MLRAKVLGRHITRPLLPRIIRYSSHEHAESPLRSIAWTFSFSFSAWWPWGLPSRISNAPAPMLRTTTTETVIRVSPEDAGLRLDRFLAARFSSCGLRGWRRLCENGHVLVNGRPAPPALKLAESHTVSVSEHAFTALSPSTSCLQPAVITATEDLAAVYKPSGMHSAAITGSTVSSVESLLESKELLQPTSGFAPQLLNRLDFDTSGLLMLARSPQGKAQWLTAENAGTVEKYYIALVHGLPEERLEIRVALDTANRVLSKPLEHDSPSPLRSTAVVPVCMLSERSLRTLGLPAQDVGLVACRIRKGARHQIRAHLAWRGHPLVGDTLYGSPHPGPFFLHHGIIALPAFSAESPAPWGIEELATLPANLSRTFSR